MFRQESGVTFSLEFVGPEAVVLLGTLREYVERLGKKMAHREGKNLIATYEDSESGLETQEILNILKVNRIL